MLGCSVPWKGLRLWFQQVMMLMMLAGRVHILKATDITHMKLWKSMIGRNRKESHMSHNYCPKLVTFSKEKFTQFSRWKVPYLSLSCLCAILGMPFLYQLQFLSLKNIEIKTGPCSEGFIKKDIQSKCLFYGMVVIWRIKWTRSMPTV